MFKKKERNWWSKKYCILNSQVPTCKWKIESGKSMNIFPSQGYLTLNLKKSFIHSTTVWFEFGFVWLLFSYYKFYKLNWICGNCLPSYTNICTLTYICFYAFSYGFLYYEFHCVIKNNSLEIVMLLIRVQKPSRIYIFQK